MMSKLYMIQGASTIKAITIGNNIVQENDISWSKRILGKEALTHIKTNTIIQDFIPIVRPYIIPSIKGYEVIVKNEFGIIITSGLGENIKTLSKKYNMCSIYV